jgi:hypothetical protein
MIFLEKKTKKGYTYKVEDVFGEIEIVSTTRLVKKIKDEDTGEEKEDGSLLDDMVLLLLRENLSAEIVTGEVVHDEGKVSYTFKRAPLWSEDDEEDELCEDTPTSTKKPAKEFILISQLIKRVLNWPKRFVEAFREAWKKAKK